MGDGWEGWKSDTEMKHGECLGYMLRPRDMEEDVKDILYDIVIIWGHMVVYDGLESEAAGSLEGEAQQPAQQKMLHDRYDVFEPVEEEPQPEPDPEE